MVNITKLLIVTGILTLAGIPALAQQQSTTNSNSSTTNSNSSPARLSAADRQYLVETATGSTHEFEVAQLGAQKAASPTTEQYAQRLLNDHATLNAQLMQLAHQERIMVPVQPLSSSSEQQTIERLKRLSGSAFDQAFAQEMVRINSEDISSAQQELRTTQNPNIRAFINQLIPTDQQHLQIAQSIAQNSAQNSSNQR